MDDRGRATRSDSEQLASLEESDRVGGHIQPIGASGKAAARNTVLVMHDVASEMRCPLSGLLFEDPVLTTAGSTFERAHIERWLVTHDTDPVSGVQLESKVLIPNTTVRKAAEQLRASRGAASSSAGSSSFDLATGMAGRQRQSSCRSSSASSTSTSPSYDAAAQQELAAMRKKLGAFMLGGDTSGGQAGTHAALTLSNAITNLSVGCWSQIGELEPLAAATLAKWRQQIRWYLAPLEHIVVKREASRTLSDGSVVEVMEDALREDIATHLPLLREADELQQAVFTRFADREWGYRKRAAGGEGGEGADGGKWWKRVAALQDGRDDLSRRWRVELSCLVAWASRKIALCREVNDACLERMEVPPSFVEALPKHARALAIAEPIRRALTKGHRLDGPAILQQAGVGLGDKLVLLETINSLQKASLVWERKGHKDKDAAASNARFLVSVIKAQVPELDFVLPMASPRPPRGLPVASPRSPDGLPVASPRSPMASPWPPHGLPMASPWPPRGLPVRRSQSSGRLSSSRPSWARTGTWALRCSRRTRASSRAVSPRCAKRRAKCSRSRLRAARRGRPPRQNSPAG